MFLFSTFPRHVRSKLIYRMTVCLKIRHASFNRSSTTNRTKNFVIPLHHVYLKMLSFVGEETASSIFNNIRESIIEDETPVMEFRAGDGYLTRKLLDADVKNLYVYERRSHYYDKLNEVLSHHPGRGQLQKRTFNDVFFEEDCIPLFNSRYLEASLPFTSVRKPWEDRPSLKVIGAHSNGKVLIVALIHLSKNMMYLGMGRPQFILSLPSSSWAKLMKHPRDVTYHNFQTAGVLFPDFFDIELLGTSPPPVHYSTGLRASVAKEEFVTISITPRKDLDKVVTPTVLEEYLFFGTQTMNGKAKHAYVIPTLEKWLPGSGKELVLQDVNCFTQFTDLSAEEAFRIFNIWRTSPNFKSSLFMYEFQDYIQYNEY